MQRKDSNDYLPWAEAHAGYLIPESLPVVDLGQAAASRRSLSGWIRCRFVSTGIRLRSLLALLIGCLLILVAIGTGQYWSTPKSQPSEFEQIGIVLQYLVNRVKVLDGTKVIHTDLHLPEPKAVTEQHINEVIEITVERANARIIPSLEGQVLLSLARGTRLLVRSQRDDEWAEVWLPTGEIAYLSDETFRKNGEAK